MEVSMSMRVTMLRLVSSVIVAALSPVVLVAQSSATNRKVVPATNAKPATVQTNRTAALEARVRYLEAEVAKLWRYAAWVKSQIPGEQTIARIADTRASIQVNRYLGGKSDDPTRMPLTASEGGVVLPHIVVGNDRVVEPMVAAGLRIAIAARGPKVNGNALVTVYALPLADPVLRPAWLVHADGNVPYLDGVTQAHFFWKGHFVDGKKAPAGKYRLFVRVIASETSGKRIGGAMRWWGGTDAASSVIEIK